MFRQIDARPDEAEALWSLATALEAAGQREQADSCRYEALAIFESIGLPRQNR
jgi:Flp pilus assembly protein TadD